MKDIVFATNNEHKLSELRQIMAGKYNVLSLADIGCHDDIPETASTLEGNAMIKAQWVKEHYGFHVTNLNIAQVKQKHGIIERENYNMPKSENSRQPGCPEEKVKAIEDALRHFQMI